MEGTENRNINETVRGNKLLPLSPGSIHNSAYGIPAQNIPVNKPVEWYSKADINTYHFCTLSIRIHLTLWLETARSLANNST